MNLGHDYGIAIWQFVKRSGGPDKFAHTYVGLAIWVVAGLLLRRSRHDLLPLLIVIAAELLNECIDRLTHSSWRWPDTIGDIAASIFWPAVLTFTAARPAGGAPSPPTAG